LRLVDLEGKTQRELAEVQGLSLSGAKSRVQRARVRLRERLEACCTFAFDAHGGIVAYEPRRRDECRGSC
jgi:RNA polymerase sigma-70 factor (ECF subfamily)